MAKSDVQTTWVMEAADVFQKLEKIEVQVTRIGEQMKRTGKAGGEAAKEALGPAAQLLKEMQAPLERYQQRMLALNSLLGQQKITQAQYAAEVKRTKEQFEAAGRAGQDAFGGKALGMARELIGALGIPMGIAGAVYLVKSAYAEWIQEIKKAGAVSTEFNEKLIADLAKIGELHRAKEIGAFLGGIPGVSREHARQTYAAIGEAAPRMGVEQKQELTREIAPLGVTGLDLSRMGTLAGELAEMAPGIPADDVVDLVVALNKDVGREAGQLTSRKGGFLKYARRMLAQGKPIEEVLATGVAAIQGGYQAEDVQKLTAAERATIPGRAAGYAEARRTDMARGIVGEMIKDGGFAEEKAVRDRRKAEFEKTPESLQMDFMGRQKEAYADMIQRVKASSNTINRIGIGLGEMLKTEWDLPHLAPGETLYTYWARAYRDYPEGAKFIEEEKRLNVQLEAEKQQLIETRRTNAILEQQRRQKGVRVADQN